MSRPIRTEDEIDILKRLEARVQDLEVIVNATARYAQEVVAVITGSVIRTSDGPDRIQIDQDDGIVVYNDDVATLRIHPGDGGIDLTSADTDTPPADRKIRWLDDGTVAQEIDNYVVGGTSFGRLSALMPSGGTSATAILQALHENDVSFAALQVSTGATDYIDAVVDGLNRRVLDHNNRSEFPRMTGGQASIADRQLQFGTATVTFTNTDVATVTVNHTLTSGTPKMVDGGSNGGSLFAFIDVTGIESYPSSNQVEIACHTSDGALVTGTFEFNYILYC